MPQADQATIDLLTDYFDAMEAKDFYDRLSSDHADNITLTFANAPPSGFPLVTWTHRLK